MRLTVVVACLVAACGGEAARILGVFPYPSRSHMTVYSALTTELARRGHELVVVSPYPLAKPMANYTDVDTMPAVAAIHDAVFNADIYEMADFPLILILTSFWEEGLWVTEETLKMDKARQSLCSQIV
jgi:predicted P-loop ATPase/GTPase